MSEDEIQGTLLTDEQLLGFAPFGFLLRSVGGDPSSPYASGMRLTVAEGGGGDDWFLALTEFDADTAFPREALMGEGALVIRRGGELFLLVPLTERDAWRSWVKREERA